MTHERCDTCRFWDNSSQLGQAEPDTTGVCRINPPVLDKRTGCGLWPYTEDSDWCGRWMVVPTPAIAPKKAAKKIT